MNPVSNHNPAKLAPTLSSETRPIQQLGITELEDE